MLICYVTDQLLNQYGLTYTGAAEQTDLTALGIRAKKVDDLDACLKDFRRRFNLRKLRCGSVNRYTLDIRVQRAFAIDRLTDNIKHTAERTFADRHHYRAAGICDLYAS